MSAQSKQGMPPAWQVRPPCKPTPLRRPSTRCALSRCPCSLPTRPLNAVCTTLSFSGSSAFTRLARKFDVVVIDEAAQVGLMQRWVLLLCYGAHAVGNPAAMPHPNLHLSSALRRGAIHDGA